ncbi:MAG: 2-hydroxyglutaryl-CoA dehydratase [Candidatus Cloacimonetes bacterium]|nr:2-hydroxyglutaryl-CoA dehydratase [Candidatus Cloacimonadota bacterium]
MKYCAGLDIGSRNTKLVIWDDLNRTILFSRFLTTGMTPLESVQILFRMLQEEHGFSAAEIRSVFVTGYGRHLYQPSTKTITEISAHAIGVRYFHPDCRTIIDIGGQDAKIITLDSHGGVNDFVMNDKCAAGTGRFLEMTAMRLHCTCDELADLAAYRDQDISLTTTCVVFAESEIIGLVATGQTAPNIAHAVHTSIARRIHTQMAALAILEPIVFTGGVALNRDIGLCLERELQIPILSPPDPEITAALGAAILASGT